MLLGKKAMLKIQRSANGKVVFTLSGRIETEDVVELQRLFDLETTDHPIVLDLKDVTLADRDRLQEAACECYDVIRQTYQKVGQ